MLQAANYLERAILAEHKAEAAPSTGVRDSYLEIAKSWRSLANGAYYEEVMRPQKKPF
jgi:hypothetical protein